MNCMICYTPNLTYSSNGWCADCEEEWASFGRLIRRASSNGRYLRMTLDEMDKWGGVLMSGVGLMRGHPMEV